MKWRTFSGNPITKDLKIAVKETIIKEKALGNQLKVCIGTDSQVRGKKVEFATVIVFLREGRGGFMYVSNYSMKTKMSLKERMLYEVSKSIEVAYNLCGLLDQYNVDLEVHADINTNPQFKSNPALSEAMGYIMSMGFEFKAKPNAFASTSCADKMC